MISYEEPLQRYCRMIEERSKEHEAAMKAATENRWWSIAMAILRMEIDSLIRVVYLFRQEPAFREEVVLNALNGAGKFPVGDRAMKNAVTGFGDEDEWTTLIYDLACRFVHLTSAHDYGAIDPFQALRLENAQLQRQIITVMNKWHDVNLDTDSSFAEIAPNLWKVRRKIGEVLERRLAELKGT